MVLDPPTFADDAAGGPSPIGTPKTPTRTVRFGLQPRDVVPVVMTLTGVASVMSGQEPTGNVAADWVLTFSFGAALVWISRWVSPEALTLSAVLALLFTGFQIPAVGMALLALVGIVVMTSIWRFDAPSWTIGTAISTCFLSQAVLNLPNIRFVGTASLLAAIAVGPMVISGFRRLPARYRRRAWWLIGALVMYSAMATVLAVVAALTVRNHVEVAIDQAESGIAAVEQGAQPEAVALLEASRLNFEFAAQRLGGAMTLPARLVPIAAQHTRALEAAADQGAALTNTASRTITRADVEAIRGRNGSIDLDLIADINVELASANAVLARSQQTLVDVRTAWLLPQLDARLETVQQELSSAAEDIDLAAHATSVLPDVLGADGQRRYLVLFVQPAEAREFGGFVGAYGILEATDGQLALTESGSINTDLGSGTATYANPGLYPEPYVRIGPQINPQNLTSIADLSTIAAAAAEFVPQWRQDPDFTIDGVITIDPYALAGFLELTGPVTLDGRDEPISAATVAEFLLYQQYAEFEISERSLRQDLLRVLAAETFSRLLTIDVPGPERLGAIFGPLARGNRIGFTTYNGAENEFFHRVFLSSDLPAVEPTTDFLGIYTATGVAAKLDAHLGRATTYVVDVDPETGAVVGQVEVSLSNNAPPDGGPYILGGTGHRATFAGQEVQTGTNILALSVYAHEEISGIEADRRIEIKEPSPALGYERSWAVLEVPLGETTTARFSTTTTVEPGRYDLVVPPAQSARPGDFTLVVRPAPGWRVLVASDAGVVGDDNSWTRTVSTDTLNGFAFTFERTG